MTPLRSPHACAGLLLAATTGCISLPSSTEDAGLPAEAQAAIAARPPWRSPGEAIPDPALSDLLTLPRGMHAGPLRGGFLLCRAETTYSGGDRRRTWAARRGVDTALPDLSADLYLGRHGQRVVGPDNASETLAALSLVDLDSGDALRLTLWDRGFLRQNNFDTLTGSYGDVLPMTLEGEHSKATCYAVPRADVEAAMQRTLPEVDAGLARLQQRVVELDARDLGRDLSPDPRAALDRPAALVGWHHPALQARVAQVVAADADFQARLVQAARAASEAAPASVTVGGTHLTPERMRCPRPLGFVRRGYSSDCVLELAVELSPDAGDRLDIEVITADWAVVPVYGLHLPAGAGLLDEVQRDWPAPGTSAVLLYGYSAAWGEPVGLRVWDGAGQKPVWVGLSGAARW